MHEIGPYTWTHYVIAPAAPDVVNCRGLQNRAWGLPQLEEATPGVPVIVTRIWAGLSDRRYLVASTRVMLPGWMWIRAIFVGEMT